MTKELERKYLLDLIKKALELNISNCEFMKKLYKDSKDNVKTFNLSIRQSKKALEKISHIKHIELLRSVYGDMVGKTSGYLMLGGTLIVSKKMEYFDTEKGFKEFKEINEQAQKEQLEKLEEQKKNREAIQKAKEQGKKVEFMIDPITKKLKPVIMEKDNNNA